MQQERRDMERRQRPSEPNGKGQLANGMAWFSIGLGLAELMAPKQIAQIIGLPDEDRTRGVLRAYGCREIAAGIGILSQPQQQAGWMWGRVAGDLLDLGSLMSAMNSEQADRTKIATATAAVLGVTALDVMCAQQLSHGDERAEVSDRQQTRFSKSIKVNRPPDVVYNFWRNLENLPSFMPHLESVQVTGNNRSHWKAKALGGMTLEWDAEIVTDEPNHLIAWRSDAESTAHHCGSVRFEPGPVGRGTLVTVNVEYAPPGGAMSSRLARLFGQDPAQQIERDLRAFKQVMETGEVVRSDASIHRGMHAAQPPARYAGQLRGGK